MIIPPDPEKDPRLFSASSSTPSLLPPGSESDIAESGRNAAVGYPFNDDLGVGYSGDFLPPYERRMAPTAPEVRERHESRPLPLRLSINPTPSIDTGHSPASDLTITPTTFASTSRHALPIFTSDTASITDPSSSTAKLWESSATKPDRKGKGKERAYPVPAALSWAKPLRRRTKAWWDQYKRWIVAAVVFLLIGVGVMIGILVGYKRPMNEENGMVQSPAWHDDATDGRRSAVWADGSMNLTWVPSRDNPPSSDGNLSLCNTFTPLNTSNFTSLSYPYPSNKLWSSTYLINLSRINTSTTPWTLVKPTYDTAGNASTKGADVSRFPTGLLSDLPIFARGIASSGTLEFIGADSPPEVIAGGVEGAIRIDVVVQYGGMQDVQNIMKVCQVSKPDGSSGVGIYTPTQTDGKISNLYALDPTTLPSFHIIVRLPPSLMWNAGPGRSPPIHLESATMTMSNMGVRVGDLEGIAEFGRFNVSSGRGGAVVDYLAARSIWIASAENVIRGRFNVSDNIYVNSSNSAILADVILHDPAESVNTTLTSSRLYSRGLPDEYDSKPSPPATPSPGPTSNASSNSLTSDGTIASFSNNISTTFSTTDGFVRVRYIAHPPKTGLTSWIAVTSGEMDISLHPNYVGPFVVRNAWGAVRIPPLSGPYMYNDPLGQGRQRAVVEGAISVPPASVYARAGLNETLLPRSGTTITGAAYWQNGTNGTLSPQAVQSSEEGARNQVFVLGGWGDVVMRFDGT